MLKYLENSTKSVFADMGEQFRKTPCRCQFCHTMSGLLDDFLSELDQEPEQAGAEDTAVANGKSASSFYSAALEPTVQTETKSVQSVRSHPSSPTAKSGDLSVQIPTQPASPTPKSLSSTVSPRSSAVVRPSVAAVPSPVRVQSPVISITTPLLPASLPVLPRMPTPPASAALKGRSPKTLTPSASIDADLHKPKAGPSPLPMPLSSLSPAELAAVTRAVDEQFAGSLSALEQLQSQLQEETRRVQEAARFREGKYDQLRTALQKEIDEKNAEISTLMSLQGKMEAETARVREEVAQETQKQRTLDGQLKQATDRLAELQKRRKERQNKKPVAWFAFLFRGGPSSSSSSKSGGGGLQRSATMAPSGLAFGALAGGRFQSSPGHGRALSSQQGPGHRKQGSWGGEEFDDGNGAARGRSATALVRTKPIDVTTGGKDKDKAKDKAAAARSPGSSGVSSPVGSSAGSATSPLGSVSPSKSTSSGGLLRSQSTLSKAAKVLGFGRDKDKDRDRSTSTSTASSASKSSPGSNSKGSPGSRSPAAVSPGASPVHSPGPSPPQSPRLSSSPSLPLPGSKSPASKAVATPSGRPASRERFMSADDESDLGSPASASGGSGGAASATGIVRMSGGRVCIRLPNNVIEIVFGLLTLRDVEVSQQTCKTWRNCIIKTGVWRNCYSSFLRSQQLAAAAAKEAERRKRAAPPSEHRHYMLSIEVPKPESYTVSVLAEDVANKDCDAGKSTGPLVSPSPSFSAAPLSPEPSELKRSGSSVASVFKKASSSQVSADKSKRAITITICSQHTRGLDNELKFCTQIIQQHTLLTQTKLEKANLLAKLDSNDGLKKMLTGQIGGANEKLKRLKNTIEDLQRQVDIDTETNKFLSKALVDMEKKLNKEQKTTADFLAATKLTMDDKRKLLESIENEKRLAEEEYTQLRSHKALLAKEVKSLQDQVEAAKIERETAKLQYQQLRDKLAALKR